MLPLLLYSHVLLTLRQGAYTATGCLHGDGVLTRRRGAGNVELYLKVISQITSLYKAETNNMLFGTEEAA